MKLATVIEIVRVRLFEVQHGPSTLFAVPFSSAEQPRGCCPSVIKDAVRKRLEEESMPRSFVRPFDRPPCPPPNSRQDSSLSSGVGQHPLGILGALLPNSGSIEMIGQSNQKVEATPYSSEGGIPRIVPAAEFMFARTRLDGRLLQKIEDIAARGSTLNPHN
ncbi:hypothetical protein WN51_10324 [Melipona quadrifasciata]|uniref:Uncharacterized protein n=1 Tax=Melipona quadrifasciata TaxID=166423 RepID=A0A0M8ZQ72_9HYME|nr:hypothetical protein WN51_10324 [Melipona quadrifasciata]